MSQAEDLFDRVFPDSSSIRSFQEALSSWFEAGGKDYPWRRTRDPYAILVSELMLQQTQVAAVLKRDYFGRWMRRFPNCESLASAEEAEILKAWEGLGYYSRARNLQRAAQVVCEEHEGKFPEVLGAIIALPGVGRYTAGAVLSFAFDRRAEIVDGNVTRVLSHLFGDEEPVDTTASIKRIWNWADRLTPESGVRIYNSAIMELGQQVCRRSSPDCAKCPVAGFCVAHREGAIDRIPAKKGRVKAVRREEHVAIVMDRDRILLAKETGGRRRGLWCLPAISPEEASDLEELFRFDYAITRFRVDLRVHLVPGSLAEKFKESCSGECYLFSGADSLPPLGAPYRKAILRFFDEQRPSEGKVS